MAKKFYYEGVDGFRTEALSYESTDFTAVGGAGNENKPILTDGTGKIDGSLIDFGAIDHGGLSGLGDDDHVQYLLIDGTRAMTGNLQMNSNEVFSSATPSTANSLVNKAYADSLRTENGMKGNVDVATTGNITLSGEQTIDGFLTSSSRVLVKDQTDPTENGIYVSGSGAWVRSEDMDNSPTAEVVNGVIIPRVQNSASGQETQSFYISSVGTGANSVHTIGSDDIVFEVYTTSSQLVEGSGITFAGNVVNIDLADTDPGLYFDGNDDIGIDWSVAYNDAKAIKASDLSSTTATKGGDIIGFADPNNQTAETTIGGAVAELYEKVRDRGVSYTAGTGGVAKGDLIYISAANEGTKYSITLAERAIGVALDNAAQGASFVSLANDTVVEGVLSGATPGDAVYWGATGLTQVKPNVPGQYVYRVGIAKNATDLHVEIEFEKKNA
jgi:hypothetical protein